MSSDVRDFKEAMNEPITARKGLGFASYLYGILVLIIAVASTITNSSFEGMSSGLSCAIFYAIAALLIFTGYFLVKETTIGDILAWISSLVTLILGAVMTFTSFKGTMVFGVFLLLAGALMLIVMIYRTVKGKNKTE